MDDRSLSINFYFCDLMADERQRGSHEIVQSRDNEGKGLISKVNRMKKDRGRNVRGLKEIGLIFHGEEELDVAVRLFKTAEQQVHRVERG
jgi:hypothetical protein